MKQIVSFVLDGKEYVLAYPVYSWKDEPLSSQMERVFFHFKTDRVLLKQTPHGKMAYAVERCPFKTKEYELIELNKKSEA